MRTVLIAVCLVATAWLPVNAQGLRGTVTNANGEMLSGALVTIYTAHPKVGPGVL